MSDSDHPPAVKRRIKDLRGKQFTVLFYGRHEYKGTHTWWCKRVTLDDSPECYVTAQGNIAVQLGVRERPIWFFYLRPRCSKRFVFNLDGLCISHPGGKWFPHKLAEISSWK